MTKTTEQTITETPPKRPSYAASIGRECMAPNCTTIWAARGLCENHYQVAVNLVERFKTTWEELEKNGRTKPVKKSKNEETREWLLG